MSAVGLISLVLFAWAASGMMTAIRQGLETAMHVTESRPLARGKLVDLLLIIGAAVLVLVTAGLTLLAKFLQSSSGSVANATGLPAGTLVTLLLHGGALALSVVIVLLLYRFVPARGLSIRDGLAGAIATGLLLQLIALASAWTYERATRLSVVYGSLTAALVFLYSIYLYSAALLLGAEVAAGGAPPPPRDAAPPHPPPGKDALPGRLGRRGLAPAAADRSGAADPHAGEAGRSRPLRTTEEMT